MKLRNCIVTEDKIDELFEVCKKILDSMSLDSWKDREKFKQNAWEILERSD